MPLCGQSFGIMNLVHIKESCTASDVNLIYYDWYTLYLSERQFFLKDKRDAILNFAA